MKFWIRYTLIPRLIWIKHSLEWWIVGMEGCVYPILDSSWPDHSSEKCTDGGIVSGMVVSNVEY